MNEHQYSQLSSMIRDILAISTIEVDVQHAFSLSNRIVIVIRSQLSLEIIIDMTYKTYLSRHNKEFKFFGNTASL